MARNIVIYQDQGVGEFGLSCLRDFFAGDHVELANAAKVIDGKVLQKADLFVMPGGADLPYCKKLNGAGNKNIRRFVEDGGIYLGLCAGAYYACRDIEYHKGRIDEICGPRELAFIDATAYGSLPDLAPWYNDTLDSAAIASVDGRKVFYNGGCAFLLRDSDASILASYDDIPGQPPAIISKSIGKGRVVLSGVHFEIGREHLRKWDVPAEEKTAQEKLVTAFDEENIPYWKSLIQ